MPIPIFISAATILLASIAFEILLFFRKTNLPMSNERLIECRSILRLTPIRRLPC